METIRPESANDGLSSWDELRRIADEIELHIHLAGMNARDRWRALEPRVAALEKLLSLAGDRAGDFVTNEIASLGELLKKLRADIANEN